MYHRTYETNPELWDEDLSFLAKLEYSQGEQAVLASGWHRRQIEFEYPKAEFQGPPNGVGIIDISGAARKKDAAWTGVTAFEIEISLDDVHQSLARELLKKVVSDEVASMMLDSMNSMNTRVSANRKDFAIVGASGVEATVDLLSLNLPARSGETSTRLVYYKRWCRVFCLPDGTVTLYQEIADDLKKFLRWPHNCIWLNRGLSYYTAQTSDLGSPLSAIKAPISYLEYNLENWRVEFEFWQDLPFQIANSDSLVEATNKLAVAQQEIGVLSSFITNAYLALRNLERRVENNLAVVNDNKLLTMITEHAISIREHIDEYRKSLAGASGLLANTAQSVQAIASEQTAKAAMRTNSFVTYASAVFFLPTLIISFYSMQIIGTNESDFIPSAGFVALLCFGAVGLGLLVLLFVRYLVGNAGKNSRAVARKLS